MVTDKLVLSGTIYNTRYNIFYFLCCLFKVSVSKTTQNGLTGLTRSEKKHVTKQLMMNWCHCGSDRQ